MARDRFAIGMARLIEHFQANAAVNIIYHKLEGGVDTVIPLVVWVGDTLFKILEKDNQRMQWSDRDYLIPVANLVIGVVPFYPAKGHWIEELLPDPYGLQSFEIGSPDKEQDWRYDDLQHTVYRVHTKRVTT